MAITDRLRLFVTPWMNVRHKSKPNIQRPRHPHWQRLKMIRSCQPIFERPLREDPECARLRKSRDKPLLHQSQEIEEYPYAQILAKILFHSIRESNMVAIFHRNSLGMTELKAVVNVLAKHDMKIVKSNKKLAHMALEGTTYSGLLNLLGPHTTVVTSPEPQVDRLFRLAKKIPQLVLLGGMVEGRLMSKEEMDAYRTLPDLTTLRQQLTTSLTLASAGILGAMTSHQRELGRCLDRVADKPINGRVKTT